MEEPSSERESSACHLARAAAKAASLSAFSVLCCAVMASPSVSFRLLGLVVSYPRQVYHTIGKTRIFIHARLEQKESYSISAYRTGMVGYGGIKTKEVVYRATLGKGFLGKGLP